MNKGEALLQAIRNADVGSDVIIHNTDMSIWCVLTVKCKEHKEEKDYCWIMRFQWWLLKRLGYREVSIREYRDKISSDRSVER